MRHPELIVRQLHGPARDPTEPYQLAFLAAAAEQLHSEADPQGRDLIAHCFARQKITKSMLFDGAQRNIKASDTRQNDMRCTFDIRTRARYIRCAAGTRDRILDRAEIRDSGIDAG